MDADPVLGLGQAWTGDSAHWSLGPTQIFHSECTMGLVWDRIEKKQGAVLDFCNCVLPYDIE